VAQLNHLQLRAWCSAYVLYSERHQADNYGGHHGDHGVDCTCMSVKQINKCVSMGPMFKCIFYFLLICFAPVIVLWLPTHYRMQCRHGLSWLVRSTCISICFLLCVLVRIAEALCPPARPCDDIDNVDPIIFFYQTVIEVIVIIPDEACAGRTSPFGLMLRTA
jgi:hypothetical protein